MDAKEFHSLQEAYDQVHQLDEVLDTPERATEYGKKVVKSVLDASAKAILTKDKKHLKTLDKRIKGAEMAKRKAEKKAAEEEAKESYDIILSHLLEEGYASTEEAADKIILNMSESWFEEIVEARRSEKEGKGSPEKPLSYPGRKIQKERGEMGGRHQYSGNVEYGGAAAERGRKKSDPHSQHRRLEKLRNYPEQPGKYSKIQNKKRDLGSRFD